MRIRNAAVAGATALAIAFSGVASAETTDTPKVPNIENPQSEFYHEKENLVNGDREIKLQGEGNKTSSDLGDKLGKTTYVDGREIFGSSKNDEMAPWAKLFYASGILGAIGTVIGTIIAAVNYGLHEGLIKF